MAKIKKVLKTESYIGGVKSSKKKSATKTIESSDLKHLVEKNQLDADIKTKIKVDAEKSINVAFSDSRLGETEHIIFNADNKNIPKVQDESVHLIVTSPPYYNAKEYSSWKTLGDYLNDMRLSLEESFRVLIPGRKYCLNISDLPEKGESGVKWVPLGPMLLLEALSVGFELVDRIIWVKTPMKGFQYGSLPYPPSPLICDSMEYIYILRKPNPGTNSYKHVGNLAKEASKLKRDDYAEFTKQIWTLPRVRTNKNLGGHIAPFPYSIPERCIRLYSFVGETILDPFAGSGTTAIAAIKNRRNSIMIELDKKYSKLIKTNLKQLSEEMIDTERNYGNFKVKAFE